MPDLARRLILAALAMTIPVSVFAQRSAEDVQEAIKDKLKKEKITLRVDINGDTAVLIGAVRNVFEKDKAIAIALEHEEIESVDADLEVSAAENDNELGQDVVGEIRRYANLTVFDDAGAIVKEGKVVLFGFVTEPFKKQRIEERLHKVLGIQEFDNQIRVLPNSMQDDNLRRALASRMYRDSMFSDFASMAIPPIHIIVENARVLLTGVVRNKMAKQKAEQIARTTPGVLTVDSRLRIGN